MQHLAAKVRADGITVPIFHNDKGRNGDWVPQSSTVPGTVPGPVDLYAFDGYPGGTCHTDATPGSPNTAPDWGIWGPGGAKGGATASPNTPGFAAEFGGGWFDYWGSAGTYSCTAVREGPGYERVFYGTNLANRLTLAELLHDLRRHLVGLAARAGRLHLLRLRRGHRARLGRFAPRRPR